MLVIPAIYDRELQQFTQKYLAGVDWRWFKAQFFQESRLVPTAVSPAGARGIAQFMPATWREECGFFQWPETTDPFDAARGIEAGIHYMRRLRGLWVGVPSPPDQHQLALLSYNAGAGTIQHASQLAGSTDPVAVLAALPKVTGPHAAETRRYVARIDQYYAQLLADGLRA